MRRTTPHQARHPRLVIQPAHLERPLLAYINSRLNHVDYRRGPELARLAWATALGTLTPSTETGMEEDIPVWLARAARRVLRERTSPTHHAQSLTTVKRTIALTDVSDIPLAA